MVRESRVNSFWNPHGFSFAKWISAKHLCDQQLWMWSTVLSQALVCISYWGVSSISHCVCLSKTSKKMQMVHEGEISTGHVKTCMIQCKHVRDNRLEPFQLCGRNFLIFFLGLQVRFGPGNMLHLSRLSDSQNRIWIIWIGWKTLKHPTLLDNTRSLFASDMGCNQKAPLGTKRTKGTTEKIYSQPDTAAVYTNRI